MNRGVHAVVGYVAAVLVASLAFVLIGEIVGVLFYGALSAVYPITERIFQLVVMTFTMFLIVTFITFFTAWLPVMLVYNAAKRLSIQNVWYYVALGASTGLALASLTIAVMPSWYTDPPELPPLWIRTWNLARFSVPSGALGGLIFWLATGRFVKRRETAA